MVQVKAVHVKSGAISSLQMACFDIQSDRQQGGRFDPNKASRKGPRIGKDQTSALAVSDAASPSQNWANAALKGFLGVCGGFAGFAVVCRC